MYTSKRPLLEIVAAGISYLSRRQKIDAVLIFGLLTVVGGIEALAISTIYPLAMMIVDLEETLKHPIMASVKSYIGIQSPNTILLTAVISVCALITASTIANIAVLYNMRKFLAKTVQSVMHDFVSQNLSAPYTWFHNQNSAVLLRRIYVDVGKWHSSFLQGLVTIFQSSVVVIVAAVLILKLSPTNGIAILSITAIFSVTITVTTKKRIQAYGRIQRVENDSYVKTLSEVFSGIKDIQVNGLAKYFSVIAFGQQKKVQEARFWQSLWSHIPPIILLYVSQIAFLSILYVFWYQGLPKSEIVGQLALLGMISSRLIPAVNRMNGALSGFWDSLPFVEGLIDIADGIKTCTKEHMNDFGSIACPSDWRTITFDRVSFQYQESKGLTLSDISFKIERGKSYGVVGFSGAGKSTVIDILLGLYKPDQGKIYVDQTPIDELSLESWQSQIGYVPQKPFISDDTVRANVAFGQAPDTVCDEAVWDALKLAGLYQVIHDLPSGLDAPLGERGMKLSGGQVQRIAIARALFKKPKLLILDEATSALDSETEATVQGAIDRMHGSITSIAIAHRVTTLKNCEEIIVFDNGQIVESGTYDQLIAGSNLFQRLAAQPDND